MATQFKQFEKNVQASFGYVKKDLLMLNDTVSDVQTKIQHLAMNHAALLQKIADLEDKIKGKKKVNGKKKVGKRKK